ncbi:MAG TPA: oligosaccharide flippase family protein [Candidatus Limnocylindria bacterium]
MGLRTLSPASSGEPAAPQPATARQTGVQVTRGALALLTTQPITWASSLATAVFIPRFLGDDGLGRYAIAWAVASFIGTISTLGIPALLQRRVATDPERASSYAWAAVAVTTGCWFALAAGLLGGVEIFGVQAFDLRLLPIAIGAALVGSIFAVLTAVLNGMGRHSRYAWSLAGATIANTTASLGTLALGGGVLGLALAILITQSITVVVLWSTSGLRFTRGAFDLSLLRQLVVGGLPFLGWNIAIRVRADIDVILTGILLQSSAAGWLAAAYRIIGVAVFVPTIITTPLLPALSRNKIRPEIFRTLLGESLATVLLLTVPISATVFAMAPLIPGLLGWSDGLQNAVPLMMVLAFQQTLVGADMVLGTALIALGLERRWLGVATIGAVFNPTLNLLAIPVAQSLTGNGAVGAAVVELATECLFLAGALRLLPRGLLGRENIGHAARIVCAGGVMLAALLLVRPYGVVPALACGGAAYAAAATAFGVLGLRHVRAVRSAVGLA